MKHNVSESFVCSVEQNERGGVRLSTANILLSMVKRLTISQ